MSTTLQLESFVTSNIRETGALSDDAAAAVATIKLRSTDGFAADDIIYIGVLGREGCEKAVIQSVDDHTTLTLVTALGLRHTAFEPVTSVLGDRIRIYRAPNVDGTEPDVGTFNELTSRTIDPDQPSTYYTDPDGSSDYWYRYTYTNVDTGDETDLADSEPSRGDDFGHYASLEDIKQAAGFENNPNLKASYIDYHRRSAEAEVNTTLGGIYTTPFTAPIPDLIQTITTQLAAGLLLQDAFRGSSTLGDTRVREARTMLDALREGSSTLASAEATNLVSPTVSSWPNDTTATTDVEDGGGKRMFHIGDQY